MERDENDLLTKIAIIVIIVGGLTYFKFKDLLNDTRRNGKAKPKSYS